MGDGFMDRVKIDKQTGMTLLELMISMAIFGIIMAGMVQILVNTNKTHSIQEQMAAMQQNVRVAKMFLERDVRMAGCGLGDFNHEDGPVYALSFANNSGEGDSDILTINYIDYGQSSCADVIPALTLSGTMPATSTEAEIDQEMGSTPYSAWDTGFSCDGVDYAGQGGGGFKEFKAIITSPDGSLSDVVYITNVQNTGGTDKVQNRPYGAFDNKVLNTYPAGSTVKFFDDRKLKQVIYQLEDGVLERSDIDASATTTSFQPVAENIEDLQFAFGLDTTANGQIDTWINSAVLNDTQKEQVRAVRINILGRTSGIHLDKTSLRQALEDHAAATASDNYVRKLIQVTIKLRNQGL